MISKLIEAKVKELNNKKLTTEQKLAELKLLIKLANL